MNKPKTDTRRRQVFFASVVSFPLLVSLTLPLAAQTCRCSDILDDLVQAVETHYIGYRFQLDNRRPTPELQRHLSISRTAVEKIETTGSECTEALQGYLNFFDDGHLFVHERGNYGQEDLDAFERSRLETRLTNVSDLEQGTTDSRTDPSGRWTDGRSEYVIISRGGEYLGYTIASKDPAIEAGLLKLRIRYEADGFDGVYHAENGVPRYVSGGLYKEGALLRLSGGLIWARIESGSRQEVASHNPENPAMPVITPLDDETVLFTIPSFLVDGDDFIQYLLANKDALFDARYLVIDVRGNTGGNALYASFMDLFADRTPEGSQGLVLASDATLVYFSRLAAMNPGLYQPVVDRMTADMRQIVDGPLYPGRTYDPAPANIQRVGILADRGSMSAAESFILAAKKYSTKVVTFGEPTGGVIDYTSVNMLPLGCSEQGMSFGYPVATLNRFVAENGYNGSGIIPDVKLGDEVENKVAFIQQYLKSSEY